MQEDRTTALLGLAKESLPLALSAGFWFGGAWLETGSLLVVAETTGFVVGVGALGAGLALAAAPAIVLGAIAIAVGDNKTVGEVSEAAHKIAPLMSPGV